MESWPGGGGGEGRAINGEESSFVASAQLDIYHPKFHGFLLFWCVLLPGWRKVSLHNWFEMEHLYFPLLSPYNPPNSFDFNTSNNHHTARYNSRYHTSIASCPPSLNPTKSHRISKQPLFRDYRPLCTLRRTDLEPILELAWNGFKRTHAACSGCLSSLGFHAPVVYRVG